jgi:S-DNA-T family DNA segregation ATPase FtsK/SpoIIIE
LTAYVVDRDAKKRIAAALALLLSQGRAVGITVVAAVQDPRKEVVDLRAPCSPPASGRG